MKKTAILTAIAGLSLLTACTEYPDPLPTSGAPSTDTTYMAAVEAAQARNVLIEEYTGVKCPNCPDGHQYIKSYESQYPNRIVAIGYYPFNQGQANPIENLSIQDFRTTKGTDLGNNYFGGIPFLPSATIDRTPFTGGAYLSDRNQWASKVSDRISTAAPVNMYVTSSYNAATREATIKVKAAFTQNVSKKVMLSVTLVENDIVDAQEYPTYIDTFYTHTHVMRDILTQTYGTPVLDTLASKTAGRVYERTFKYTINAAWKPENCKVIAFISNNETNDKEVAQVVETVLK